MRRFLGLLTPGNIREVRQLSVAEYRVHRDCVYWLSSFISAQQLFAMVRLNYLNFRQLVEGGLLNFAQQGAATRNQMAAMQLHANLCVLNYLTSVRTFLDHTETRLKRTYGAQSPQYGRFRDARTREYETSFSYRFVYKLRNYVQHCGLPLAAITFAAEVVDRESGKASFKIELNLDRDSLLSDYHEWGSQLTSEIKALQRKFDIGPHLVAITESMSRIQGVVLQDEISEANRRAQPIRTLLGPLEGQEGSPCIVAYDTNGKHLPSDGLGIEIEHFPMEVLHLLAEVTGRPGLPNHPRP